jgi:NADPH:quinone reductase-like Zn-dependent oxidoreductase
MEFAGEVEEVGSAVQEFEAGDRVFGVKELRRYLGVRLHPSRRSEVLEGRRPPAPAVDGAGTCRGVIDRRYPLEDVVEATRYVETGQKTGNVALTVT